MCGGYTSKNWDHGNKEKGSFSWKFVQDTEAFVFNMDQKYTPQNYDKAIRTIYNGFSFGNGALRIEGDALNGDGLGGCNTGEYTYYSFEGEVSPLTNEK